MTFLHSGRFGVGTYIPVTRIMKSGKTQTYTQAQSNRSWLDGYLWVRVLLPCLVGYNENLHVQFVEIFMVHKILKIN